MDRSRFSAYPSPPASSSRRAAEHGSPTTDEGARKRKPDREDSPTPPFRKVARLGTTRSGSNAVIIAHSDELQPLIEELPWGVQWELVRIVTAGQDFGTLTKDVLKRLRNLGNNEQAAPETVKLFRHNTPDSDPGGHENDNVFSMAYAQEYASTSPWKELDREQKYMKIRPLNGGLGCNEEVFAKEPDPAWYGGSVDFSAKLTRSKGETSYRLVLVRAVLGTSCRLTRRFGSHALLRVHIPSDIFYSNAGDLRKYFARPFILNGRVFRVWRINDMTALLIATTEKWDGNCILKKGSPGMSYLALINWHNPMQMNQEQTMVKWAARFSLTTSNSVPGIRLKPSNIHVIDDLVSPTFTGAGKPPSEKIMTDGCGLANRALFRKLQEKLQWEHRPTAIQFRLAGAKGLLLLHPGEEENRLEEPTVWLRPSQIKIKYSAPPGRYLPDNATAERLTLDVLRASRMSTPARLSTETITNFAHNGVSPSVFQDLMEKAIHAKVDPLCDWSGPLGSQTLWANAGRCGSVIASRLARLAAGRARIKGHVRDDLTGDDGDDDEGTTQLEAALREQSTVWWPDEVSGCPSGLEETVMALLDSGFVPNTCCVLASKLCEVIKKEIRGYVSRFHVEVPMSCIAFIVPDPCAVLKSGEIHIKSSTRNLVDQNGDLTDSILGDVVVTRHPCKVPTDAQKVKAVSHPKLNHYVDVIVISIQDHNYFDHGLGRHLASMTGGGDYDGDTMEAFWQPELVGSFTNASPSYAVEPPEVQEYLQKSNETVGDFLVRMQNTSVEEQICEIQKYLLGPLNNPSYVGLYSTWWENSTYKNDYDNKDTCLLAYLFSAVLDGIKTGLSVRPEIFKQHKARFGDQAIPPWKDELANRKTKREFASSSFRRFVKRDLKTHGPFPLDIIVRGLCAKTDSFLKDVERRFQSPAEFTNDEDLQLSGPWRRALDRAERLWLERGDGSMKTEMQLIRSHVEANRREWHDSMSENSANKSSRVGRQDRVRGLSKAFHSAPSRLIYFSDDDIARVRASYAYVYDRSAVRAKWSRWPWDVALRDLCQIKASAGGPWKPLKQEFYVGLQFSRAFLVSDRNA